MDNLDKSQKPSCQQAFGLLKTFGNPQNNRRSYPQRCVQLRGGYDWGSAPNPARELSSLDPSLRYRQILPEEWQTRVTVERAELGSAIDRASLIAREGKTNLVCFKIDGETLEVTSNSETGDMEEKMNVMTEGKDLTIAFNVRYITDVLKALSDDQVVMRFNSNVSPCVVCPTEGDAYLYLVLPVRVFNA